MLRVDQIKNVNYTLKQPSFKAGVQTNFGVAAPKETIVENGLFTVFTSTIKNIFSPKAQERADKIEKGLNSFDAIA